MKPTQEEIDDVLNRCAAAEETGISAFTGMLYEQGVKEGIQWVLGQTPHNPMQE